MAVWKGGEWRKEERRGGRNDFGIKGLINGNLRWGVGGGGTTTQNRYKRFN